MAQYATTLVFEAGSVTTISNSAILTGTLGAKITLESSILGVQFILTKATGNVTATHTNIQDSNATGGAYWDATSRTNSNFGNNTGWDFATIPVSGEFFAFF
jgi:hypothetical protein